MVCKHDLELSEVLTAATPRLEQRFDADLKEDRILQAQHGGSQKLDFTMGGNFLHCSFTIISNPKHSALPKKYTRLTFVAPLPQQR